MTCTWEPDPGCLGDAWDAIPGPVQERALMLATSSLQMLTYYRVGTCPITVRPIPNIHRCGCGWNPHMWNGRWYNNSCGHSGAWPAWNVSEIDLDGPVGYIESFRIDGENVDFATGDWRLDDGHLLVWQGEGDSPIPTYQDLSKPDTEPGTWSITYSKSYPVSADAKIAVAYLAVEFAAACTGKGKCALPKGVTSVVRSGVSFTLANGVFINGLSGLEMVDPFILKWAPAGAPQNTAVVFDPSMLRARVSSPVPTRGT